MLNDTLFDNVLNYVWYDYLCLQKFRRILLARKYNIAVLLFAHSNVLYGIRGLDISTVVGVNYYYI